MPIVSARPSVARLPLDPMHRKLLPMETYKITAGIKGGIAGGVAMAVPAMLFGLIKYHSIWYAINLLAAGGFVSWAGQSNAFLAEFHLRGLLAAIAIHGAISLLVGLLYGAMLPMFPEMPILTCGFIAPFLWTGLALQRSWHCQSNPGSAHRLALVHRSPSALWTGCRLRGQSGCQSANSQFQALPFAVRRGIADRPRGNPREERQSPMSAVRDLCVGLFAIVLSRRASAVRTHPGVRQLAPKFLVPIK